MSDKASKPKRRPVKPQPGESAFDIWLDRGLHRLFDEVAQEPVPDELLKLIEGDRNK